MRYQADQPLSVVLNCYNKSAELDKVISSVARNTVRPELVVLSDDGSDDGSPDRFEALCRSHELRWTTLRHRRGTPFQLNRMRNSGIRACPDGLVVILDADLVPARTCFEAHRSLHLQAQDERVISTGPRLEYAFADGTGPVNFLWGFEMIGQASAPALGSLPAMPLWQTTPGSMVAITRRAVETIGWFDESYNGHYGYDDVDFMIRAARLGFRFVADWEAHVIHLPHPPALGARDNSVNRARFIAKYGHDVVYPDLIGRLCRRSWSEYYQNLAREGLAPEMATIALDTVPWPVLAKVLLLKFWRRIMRIEPKV